MSNPNAESTLESHDDPAITLSQFNEGLAALKADITTQIVGLTSKFVTRDELTEHEIVVKAYADSLFNEHDKLIRGVDDLLVKVQSALKVLNTTLSVWDGKISARDEMVTRNDARLGNAFDEINVIQGKLADVDKRGSETALAVFGDESRDGHPSLFALVEKTGTEVQSAVREMKQEIVNVALEVARNTKSRLAIEDRQKKWAERREWAAQATKGVITSPVLFRVLWGITVAIATILGYGELA